MKISRRDFLKFTAASALTLGLNEMHLFNFEIAMAKSQSKVPVIWLNGSGCSGCSISLMNAVNPTVDEVLLNNISLGYHPTLMAAAGDMAVRSAQQMAEAGGYVLVVEGGIPTGASGKYCYVWSANNQHVTMAAAVRALAAHATHIIAVGTCASYGGVSKAATLTATQGAGTFLGKKVINLPGCPTHPDWIIGTLVQLIGGTVPALDSNNRPRMYYPAKICKSCPNKEREEANRLGQRGRCLEEVGCKGEHTFADCGKRKWNNGQNWCIGVNSPCIGCTEPSFPSFPLRGGEDGGGED